jgi:hypothetical protein
LLCCLDARTNRGFRIVLAMAVMVAVLTVLIAPSIDMPETVLREHHVASHSMVKSASGTLEMVGMVPDSQVFRNEAANLHEGSEASDYAHDQTSLVMRC